MRWHISDYRVTWAAEGPPVVSLHAGEKHVADIRFSEQPGQRFIEDFETRFITLQFALSEQGTLLDLLRHERAIELDTEDAQLRFRRT